MQHYLLTILVSTFKGLSSSPFLLFSFPSFPVLLCVPPQTQNNEQVHIDNLASQGLIPIGATSAVTTEMQS